MDENPINDPTGVSKYSRQGWGLLAVAFVLGVYGMIVGSTFPLGLVGSLGQGGFGNSNAVLGVLMLMIAHVLMFIGVGFVLISAVFDLLHRYRGIR